MPNSGSEKRLMEKTLNHVAGAFRWSTEKEVTAIEIAVSALAMAVPALLAARGHHTGLGLIGGMAMSGTVAHGRLRTQAASAGAALLVLVFATGLACALSRSSTCSFPITMFTGRRWRWCC
jgi:hypothetical protein